jgi:multidrug efflux pump subunit AcrA (membrane-fusion protein)
LIVEQISEDTLTESMRRRVDVVAEHSALALANAREHNDLFLMPLWRSIGKLSWIVQARTLPKTVAIGGAVLVLLLALFIVPYPYELSGSGTLEPVMQRDIFAGLDGVVEEVKVENGQHVNKGDLLLMMRNDSLDGEIQKATGTLKEDNAKRDSNNRLAREAHSREERDRFESLAHQAAAVTISDQKQLDILQQQKDLLTVRSPITGVVITWEPEKTLLARPVGRGDRLLTVADPTQAWELEVRMPEDRMGAVTEARKALKPGEMLPVSFMAEADRVRHKGWVKEYGRHAQVMGDEGNVVLLRVKIENDGHDLVGANPGGTVKAKVRCGTASLGYVWFHDVIAFVQTKILFKFF